MKCPVCKDVSLVDGALDADLPAQACAECGGQWVKSSAYWGWLDAHGSDQPPPPQPGAVVEVASDATAAARLCPECGRLLTRAKVGRGVDFCLDRCAHCGGFWLEAREWEVLRARGLHHDLHFVFSSAWQAEVARQERLRQHERLLREQLGDADYAEVTRVKAWIAAHPKRAQLYAILLEDAEGITPPHKPPPAPR